MTTNKDKGFLALTPALCIKKKRLRRWSREWFKLSDKYTHENLLKQILRTETYDYINFLRIDNQTFNDFLELLRPLIKKKTQLCEHLFQFLKVYR